MELSDYEQKRGEDRQLYVKIVCVRCGAEKWARWDRVRKGQSRFCGLKCANAQQKEDGLAKRGKEYAYYVYSPDRNESYAHWKDADGVQHSTTYARWLWEHVNGEIPEGYRFRWKDGNPQNAVIENVEVVTPEMFSREVSARLTGHTTAPEAKQKMSEAKKGKPLTEAHKQHIGEQTKKMWAEGIFDAPEIREAYAQQGRSTKGSKRDEAFAKEKSELMRQKFSDPEYRRKFTERVVSGEQHPNWRGGVSRQIYPREFSKSLRDRIRKRDQGHCRICHEFVSSLHGRVHHIDADKLNNDPLNLIYLCEECHGKIHAKYAIEDPVILAFRSRLNY